MDKLTVWFIVGFVVLVAAVVIVAGVMSGGFDTGTTSTNTPPGFVATTVPPISSSDHVRGNANAPVSIIEYGDYECPACAEYQPVVQQILQDYGNKISLAFRNFPLYSIHPNAGISAQAAEAAGLQGKFWEMHDLLYSKQNDWAGASSNSVVQQYFNGYAQSLGLNITKFDADINSSAVMQKIQNDVSTGNTAQIDHTPTFFVNNKQIPNPGSYNDFKAALDQAFSAASSAAPVTVSTTPSSGGLLNITSTREAVPSTGR